MKSIQIEAKTVEEAVELALKELNLSEDKVDVKILAKGGLFSQAEVLVTEKEGACERALKFVCDLLEKMNFECEATATEKGDEIEITVTGKDSGGVIGYRGDTLDAIQYLTLLVANQVEGDFRKVVINAEDYRAKREETLTSLAQKLEQKVERTGRVVRLEPMNPFERRVIHTTLANSEIVRTESEGEEPNRRVVIFPKQRRAGGYNRDRGEGGGYNRDRNGGNRNRNGNGGGRSGGGYNNRGNGGGYNRDRNSGYESKVYAKDESSYGNMDGDVDTEYVPSANPEVEFTPRPAAPRKFKSFGGKKRF